MPAAAKLAPPPCAIPGLRALAYGTATAVPIGISRDRATLYGSAGGSGTALYQSSDDGATWTSVRTFAENVVGVLETDDGEALVITIGGTSTPGYIYKSSGWAAGKATATMTKTLTTQAGYLRPIWAAHAFSFGNDNIAAGTSRFGVTNEYGSQTTSSGPQTDKATRVYFTADYGTTWTQVLDLVARYPGVANLHLHASAYDPWWDRLWVTYGDTGSDAPGKQGLLYSDDHGQTWTTFDLAAEWATYLQSTPIGVFADHLLLGSDNGPGFVRHQRQGYRKLGPAQLLTAQAGGTSGQMIAMGIHRNRNQPGAPILASMVSVGSEGPVGSILASFDGLTYTELWKDATLVNNGLGVIGVFGPTASGAIVADVIKTGTTHWQLRGELVMPDAGLFDGQATFTGNGTTTAFTVAHGLPVTPTRFQGWSVDAVGGAFTVTADATNLTFTFTTAPASGTAPQVAYRYGA